MSHALTHTDNQLVVASHSLESYLQSVQNIPVLSEQEEKELAEKLRSNNDLDAAKALITHNLRFVIKVARGYNGYGLPFGDLVQEGSVGLMKAVRRFDPDANVRLISFAVHWIRAEIHEFILKNWKIVKIATTKAQRKLFFNLRSSKKRLGWLNQLEVQSIATDLGVSTKEVLEMEKRLGSNDVAFEASQDDQDSDTQYLPQLYLQAPDANPEELAESDQWDAFTKSNLKNAMATLDERSLDILQSRWLTDNKATLHELADRHNISAERVRQLEANAIKKIKEQIQSS